MTIQTQDIISDKLMEDLTAFRREIHANPEISEEEEETARKVVDALRACNPDLLLSELGGHGVAAVFDSGKEGKSLLFRAELDGLPIQEESKLAYRSRNSGKSHACGHDGHLTILLGLARVLSEHPPASGRVICLFQPAEEIGAGAKAVLEDERFDQIRPDAAYAFHNLPGYPLHEIVTKTKSFSASVKSLIIKLHGKTAHAAEPEHGRNPALAISEVLTYTAQLSNNYPEVPDFAVITPVYINLGTKAYGTSAGYGEIHLTIRAWTKKSMEKLRSQVVKVARSAAERSGLRLETEWIQEFMANRNNTRSVKLIEKLADDLGLSNTRREMPFKWGEDFGQFTQRFPGAMFGIGSGKKQPALHNPDYDFPDALIPTGIRMFDAIIRHELG